MTMPAEIINTLVFVLMAPITKSKHTMEVITPAAKLNNKLAVFDESLLNIAPMAPPSPVPPTPYNIVTFISKINDSIIAFQ